MIYTKIVVVVAVAVVAIVLITVVRMDWLRCGSTVGS